MGRLIVNGNQVYEIDEECMKKKAREKREAEAENMRMKRQGRTANKK